MRLTPEQKAKKQLKKLKLEARRMWILHDAPPEPEKIHKGEFELFKKIAKERSLMTDNYWYGRTEYVVAKHITKEWEETTKMIPLDDLTPWNFDHTTPKSRGKNYKLDPENIQIVSVAWHFWKTNWQILKVEYPN